MSEQIPSPFPEKKVSPKTVEDILQLVDHTSSTGDVEQLLTLLKPLSSDNFDLVWNAVMERLTSISNAHQHKFFLESVIETIAKRWKAQRKDSDLGIAWIATSHGEFQEHQEIELQNRETNERFPLSNLLPPGYRFVEDSEYYCKYTDKTIHFCIGEMNTKGFVLMVLHEIGHAYQVEATRDLGLSVGEAFEVLGSVFKRILIPRFSPTTEEVVITRYPILGKNELTFEDLPKWYLERVSKLTIANERNAWAFALRSARLLKEQGFDIAADFTSYQDIKDLIEYSLITYDLSLSQNRGNRAAHTPFTTEPSFTHTANRGFKKKSSD